MTRCRSVYDSAAHAPPIAGVTEPYWAEVLASSKNHRHQTRAFFIYSQTALRPCHKLLGTNLPASGEKPMKTQNFHHVLRSTPIAPHAGRGLPGTGSRFGKAAIPPGDPVAAPKPSPRYIPPPITNLTNLTLPLDLVIPDEAKAATDAGVLVFHSVGDTGGIHGDD